MRMSLRGPTSDFLDDAGEHFGFFFFSSCRFAAVVLVPLTIGRGEKNILNDLFLSIEKLEYCHH